MCGIVVVGGVGGGGGVRKGRSMKTINTPTYIHKTQVYLQFEEVDFSPHSLHFVSNDDA